MQRPLTQVTTLSVAPPFGVASLKVGYAQVEDIPSGVETRLFEDMSSDLSMNGMIAYTYLQINIQDTTDEPIAFTCDHDRFTTGERVTKNTDPS